jgi:hypothetical protein
MEAPGGDRKGFVSAMAPRSATQANAEQHLLRHAVVAVVVGFRPELALLEVKHAFAMQFHISEEAIKVTVHAQGEFLLDFADPEVRRTALSIRGALKMGSVSFLLLPWSRLRRATAESLSRCGFVSRVCLTTPGTSTRSSRCSRGRR